MRTPVIAKLSSTLLLAATSIAGAPLLSAASAQSPRAFAQARVAAASTSQETVPTSLGCSATAVSPYAQTQGDAESPICARDQWVYDLPAEPDPPAVRRTETHWGTSTAPVRYAEGSTVTYEAEYTGSLGRAGQEDNDWHVIWQLHGPSGSTWRAPALGLNVRHGEIRLGGGSGHPNQDWATRNYEWSYRLGPWTDNVPVRLKVQTYLSSDPAKGWVSAWVNDRPVLDKIRPTSYKGGLRPGTFYPGLSYVVSRTGLYRGSQGSVVPTYRQVLTARVTRTG